MKGSKASKAILNNFWRNSISLCKVSFTGFGGRMDHDEGKQIWTLTPLMDDPNDSSKQVPGGPVKVEVIYA